MWLRRIIGGRGNDIYTILHQHLQLSIEALHHLISLMENEDYTAVEKIEQIEKRCDKLAYKATRLAVEGALPILALHSIIRMIDDIDAITDKILFLAREITRYTRHVGRIERELIEGLIENAGHTVKILESLAQLLHGAANNATYEELLRMRDTIEEEEESGDEYKDKILNLLYTLHRDVSGREFIILRQLILTLDDVEDLSEDVANQLIIIKSVLEM